MKLKTRFEREELAKKMIAQGKQPMDICQVTGCNQMLVEQLVRRAGGRPINYEVEM